VFLFCIFWKQQKLNEKVDALMNGKSLKREEEDEEEKEKGVLIIFYT
jgi:hypothetical protein